jgi:hypothetical protein
MRDEGFPHADIDTGFFDDPKVRALVRSERDEGTASRALLAYIATFTASWRAGDRVTFEDAAPLWLSDLDDLSERLREVGLLDDTNRVPAHAWEAWFRPAWERREKKRASGAEGGRRSWDKRRRNSAEATPNPSHPSASSEPTQPPHANEPESLEDAICGTCRRPRSVCSCSSRKAA